MKCATFAGQCGIIKIYRNWTNERGHFYAQRETKQTVRSCIQT